MLISKSKNKEFVAGVTKGLLEMGAIKVKDTLDSFSTFELKTIVGKLNIEVVVDNQCLFTIFSRFENVEIARQKFNCNPHSGKYNIHIGLSSQVTIEQYIQIALSAFESTQNVKYSTTSPS